MKKINKLESFLKLERLRKEKTGKIFSVTFRKKNGKYRKMLGKFGVRKGITGQGVKV